MRHSTSSKKMKMPSQLWIKWEENATVKVFKRTWLKIGWPSHHLSLDLIMEDLIEFLGETKQVYTALKIPWTRILFSGNIESILLAENAAARFIIPYFTIFSMGWKYSRAGRIALIKKTISINLIGRKLKSITWFWKRMSANKSNLKVLEMIIH